MLRVYFDVGIAILLERWRSSPSSPDRAHHVHDGGGGKEGWRNSNEGISRLEKKRRREREVKEEDDMVLPIGKVNYATLIRPLEPVSSEWRVRRGGGDGDGGGYLDLDLDERKVREVEGRWSWNGWEGVPGR